MLLFGSHLNNLSLTKFGIEQDPTQVRCTTAVLDILSIYSHTVSFTICGCKRKIYSRPRKFSASLFAYGIEGWRGHGQHEGFVTEEQSKTARTETAAWSVGINIQLHFVFFQSNFTVRDYRSAHRLPSSSGSGLTKSGWLQKRGFYPTFLLLTKNADPSRLQNPRS